MFLLVEVDYHCIAKPHIPYPTEAAARKALKRIAKDVGGKVEGPAGDIPGLIAYVQGDSDEDFIYLYDMEQLQNEY